LSARYAPHGDRIALGFGDGTLSVTDAALRGRHDLLHVPKANIAKVAFDAEGTRIAAALGDGTVRVVSADGVEAARVLHGNTEAVLGVDISADGARVVSSGQDGSVRDWALAGDGAGRVLHKGTRKEADVRFSPDGKRILAVGYDGRIRFFDAGTGAAQTTISGEGRELYTAAFSADGRRFAVSGGDGVVRVWSTPTGPPVAVLRGQGARIFDIGFSRRSDRVVSAGDDGTARIWDAGTTQSWVGRGVTDDISLNRDGRLAVTGSDDGTVRVWDVATGDLRRSVTGPKGYTPSRFGPTSDTIIVGRDVRSTISLLPLSGPPHVVARTPAGVYSVYPDGAGSRIVYVDNNGGIVVRGLRSGRTVRPAGAPTAITDAKLSPDGHELAAATKSGKIVLWRLDHPARPRRVIAAHRGTIDTVNYRSDGAIVSAGADRTVKVWPTGGGAPIVLRGPDDEITTAIFTSDGRHILGASADGQLRMWDAHGGDPLVALQSGSAPVYDVSESRDGTIATFDGNEVVRVFRCEVCGSVASVRALALSRHPRPLTAADRQRFLAAAG
jgi:WD40 repeat protein